MILNVSYSYCDSNLSFGNNPNHIDQSGMYQRPVFDRDGNYLDIENNQLRKSKSPSSYEMEPIETLDDSKTWYLTNPLEDWVSDIEPQKVDYRLNTGSLTDKIYKIKELDPFQPWNNTFQDHHIYDPDTDQILISNFYKAHTESSMNDYIKQSYSITFRGINSFTSILFQHHFSRPGFNPRPGVFIKWRRGHNSDCSGGVTDFEWVVGSSRLPSQNRTHLAYIKRLQRTIKGNDLHQYLVAQFPIDNGYKYVLIDVKMHSFDTNAKTEIHDEPIIRSFESTDIYYIDTLQLINGKYSCINSNYEMVTFENDITEDFSFTVRNKCSTFK